MGIIRETQQPIAPIPSTKHEFKLVVAVSAVNVQISPRFGGWTELAHAPQHALSAVDEQDHRNRLPVQRAKLRVPGAARMLPLRLRISTRHGDCAGPRDGIPRQNAKSRLFAQVIQAI